jgi:hypothetical protein
MVLWVVGPTTALHPENHRPENPTLVTIGVLTRRIWEDNVRMDLREIGLEGVDWMHLAQDRDQWWILVNTVMKFRVP